MEFTSFEEALKVCMTAEEGSLEQDDALIYCFKNAPPELRATFKAQYEKLHGQGQGCGCGCNH